MIKQSIFKRNVSDNTLFTMAGFATVLIIVTILLQLAAWYFVVIVLTTVFNRLDIPFDTIHSLLLLICLRWFVFYYPTAKVKS